jgi:hypothetical protein
MVSAKSLTSRALVLHKREALRPRADHDRPYIGAAAMFRTKIALLRFLHVESLSVSDRMALFGRSMLKWALLVAAGLCQWMPAVARAEALVTVQLRDARGEPAEGQVTLHDSEGKSVASCDAHAGKCEMQNVPGGSYTVTVQPSRGDAPKPRKVMIPPRGKVALVVTTG